MPYSTKADIIKVIPDEILAQLTDDANGATTDDDKVTAAIATADELINTYIRARYTTPLTGTIETIKKLSVDISIFELYSRRPESEMPETVKIRYREAVRLLEKIAKGEISLGTESEDVLEPARFKSNKLADDKEFSKELLGSFC